MTASRESQGPPPGAYRWREPHAALRPFVESLWWMDAPPRARWRERILPHTRTDLVLLLRGAYVRDERRVSGSLVLGVETRPVHFEHRAGDRLLGVRLRAGGLHALGARVPASHLAGGAAARDVLGDCAEELARGVADAPFESALASLEELLGRRLDSSPDARAAARAIAAIEAGVAVGEVAARAGCSVRSLERRVLSRVGLAPRTLRALARFERAVATLDARHAREGFAPIYELGYADQAHFIREYRRFAGERPGARWAGARGARRGLTGVEHRARG